MSGSHESSRSDLVQQLQEWHKEAGDRPNDDEWGEFKNILAGVKPAVTIKESLISRGFRRLAEERRAEQAEFLRVQEYAVALMKAADEGIFERDLVAQLRSDLSVGQSVASSAADYLRSSGLANKSWTTGLLTLVTNQNIPIYQEMSNKND